MKLKHAHSSRLLHSQQCFREMLFDGSVSNKPNVYSVKSKILSKILYLHFHALCYLDSGISQDQCTLCDYSQILKKKQQDLFLIQSLILSTSSAVKH